MKLRRMLAVLLAMLMLLSTGGMMQMALAADVAAASSATVKSYQVKVTADQLNIRKSASHTSKIVGLLKKGNKVTITDEKTDYRGVVWGKTSKGWINLDFTDKSSSSYTGKVQVDGLNVRANANNTAKVIKVLSKGTKVTITDKKTDNRGVVWGKVKGLNGWINTDFIKSPSSVSYKIELTGKANIREYASVGSKVVTTAKKGTVYKVTASQKDSRGKTWVKLSNGKGWICMDNAKKVSDTFQSYKVKITTTSLKIHKSADINSSVTGYLQKDDKVTITAEKKTSDGRTWGKLSNGKGWISLKYAKKV